MPYRNDVPVDTNQVRDPTTGDLVLMRTNFAILASVVSGMTAPSQGAPMSQLVVTSGADTFGIGWSGASGALLLSGAAKAVVSPTAFNFQVVPSSSVAPSADSHLVRRQDLASPFAMVEALGGHIVTVASGSVFVLDERAMYGYDIKEAHVRTASGTVAITAKIGGTTVSGLDGVTVSGTQTSYSTSDAFTLVSGNQLTLTLGAVTGDPSDLSFTFKVVRT